MSKLKTVKITTLLGVVGDQAASWMTDKDWEEHRKHVEKLKKEGNYLKPVEVSMSFVPCPVFEEPKPIKKEQYRFITLNLKQTDK
jgi:hypothetical protein